MSYIVYRLRDAMVCIMSSTKMWELLMACKHRQLTGPAPCARMNTSGSSGMPSSETTPLRAQVSNGSFTNTWGFGGVPEHAEGIRFAWKDLLFYVSSMFTPSFIRPPAALQIAATLSMLGFHDCLSIRQLLLVGGVLWEWGKLGFCLTARCGLLQAGGCGLV